MEYPTNNEKQIQKIEAIKNHFFSGTLNKM